MTNLHSPPGPSAWTVKNRSIIADHPSIDSIFIKPNITQRFFGSTIFRIPCFTPIHCMKNHTIGTDGHPFIFIKEIKAVIIDSLSQFRGGRLQRLIGLYDFHTSPRYDRHQQSDSPPKLLELTASMTHSFSFHIIFPQIQTRAR